MYDSISEGEAGRLNRNSFDEETGLDGLVGKPEELIENADEVIRKGFVRKVFGILAVQLAVTFGIISIFRMKSIHEYVDVTRPDSHQWVLVLAMVTSFACIITLACCSNQARIFPNNMIFLSVFTLAESVLLGVVCTAYNAEAIMIAVGITALVVTGLIAYAFNTRSDFTGAGPYLFIALWCMVLYGFILSMFSSYLQNAQMAYSVIGVVLFSFFLVYDVQLIIGGKHKKFRFSIDDYVFAAINIYLDIINLFLRILEMVRRSNN